MENLFSHTPGVFKKILYISIAAHIIIIIALGIYMGGKRKVFFSPVYTVNLVEGKKSPVRKRRKKRVRRATIRKKSVKKRVVRKKAVKKHTVAVKKKPIAIKEKKAVKKPKKPSKALEKDLSDAISTIRKKVRAKEEQKLIASKIEAIKKQHEAEDIARRIARIRGSIKETPKAAKTQPMPAASSSGVSKESLKIKYKAYFSLIRDKVQENWIYPENFDNKRISVIVSIRIGRDGKLLKSWVEKGSGSRSFDDSLMKAVQKASPFAPLPAEFTEDVLETGLRFCPACE